MPWHWTSSQCFGGHTKEKPCSPVVSSCFLWDLSLLPVVSPIECFNEHSQGKMIDKQEYGAISFPSPGSLLPRKVVGVRPIFLLILKELVIKRVACGRIARIDINLIVDRAEMALDRAWTDNQLLCYLYIG